MKNLLPEVYRKRLIIEGFYRARVDRDALSRLLIELSRSLSMTPITDPLIFSPTGKGKGLHHGLAAYMGWVESGISIYTWEDKNFFTVDIYTCKRFDNETAIEVLKALLKAEELVYDELRYE